MRDLGFFAWSVYFVGLICCCVPLLVRSILPWQSALPEFDEELIQEKYVPRPISAQLQLSFHLQTQEPRTWDIEQALSTYFTKFSHKLSTIFDLSIDSDITISNTNKLQLQINRDLFDIEFSSNTSHIPSHSLKPIFEYAIPLIHHELQLDQNFTDVFYSEALHTLLALRQLVQHSFHMPFPNHVRQLVEEALERLGSVRKGERSLENAREAFELSEQAFYDMSLLPQLYFEYDQLLAVCMPLLLPISFPAVKNLVRSVKGLGG